MTENDDFFEEDEPTEKIRAAWKRGKKGRTGLPRDPKQRATLRLGFGSGKSKFQTTSVTPH